jgi:lambda family phage portal protein
MTEPGVVLYGPDSKPLPPTRSRARALSGGNGRYTGPPYDAADQYSQHMAAWQPYLWSPDGELNQYRDRIVSRVRDMVRNDGWASGAVTRILDNAVGSNLRPISRPDHRFLRTFADNPAFDSIWAKEYAAAVDANWRAWAVTDLGRYCDATRNQTFGQMMRVAFRHKLIDGDSLAVMQWIPDRVSRGRARYCTAVQLVDPDRLSNPQLRFDAMTMRGGVEIDRWGAAIAYHIRKAHAGDWFSAAESVTWERVPRETNWGRPIVVHDYEGDRASQHRGGAGIFTPVLQRLKMLVKYDGVELDASIINAIFAAYVESPFDHDMMAEALEDEDKLPFYQGQRRDFHNEKSLMLGNARIPMLYPGEKINSVAANRPTGNFKEFEAAVLRNVAAGTGLSAQQVSNNWSDVNYSSARGALLEAWKTLYRRRHDFSEGFAAPIRATWLEESHEVDDLPLPNNAPDFVSCRGAYAKCRWMGPGKGWISPTEEAGAAIMRMDGALSTLEDECAEQGLEFEEVLEQRKYEIGLFKEYGIPVPEWGGQFFAASQAKQKPEAQ